MMVVMAHQAIVQSLMTLPGGVLLMMVQA